MDIQAEIEKWQPRFSILKDWTIEATWTPAFDDGFGRCRCASGEKYAEIYDWHGEGEPPKGYVLHEMLHISLEALSCVDDDELRKAKEGFVIDIVKLAISEEVDRMFRELEATAKLGGRC